jgi:hypothetical protein
MQENELKAFSPQPLGMLSSNLKLKYGQLANSHTNLHIKE